MDLKNLSKYKHLYVVNINRNNQISVEKFPIVYINSFVIYYKAWRKNSYLSNVPLARVKDWAGADLLRASRYTTLFYFDIPTDIVNNIRVLQGKLEEAQKRRELEKWQSKIEANEKEIEMIKQKIVELGI